MIELFQFQQEASATIAERFIEYLDDRVNAGTTKNPRVVPFFQALSSLTASGKTVILSDATAAVAAAMPVAPVVLWLSKGKVVVEQSYANLLPGGKYSHLLGDFSVRLLAEYDPVDVEESTVPLMYFATVGTFNDKDKSDGNKLIYRCEIDNTNASTWEALKVRTTQHGQKRPLIVVYDEAHNLSDQQTALLMELQPDGFLLASATMKLPARLSQEVEALRRHGRSDDWLITQVNAKDVADAGLVKSTLILGGYRAPMEETVDTMLADMAEAEADAKQYGLPGLPKAIYVCNTNMISSDNFRHDEIKQPFLHREAAPILIWRHLTENAGIDPAEIAVYASLKFHKDYPAPSDFVLFAGADKDYDRFTAGTYRHIIFNLSLQEGWDDPMCYFAYIDKSMESKAQVEQVIGRVLRQPEAKHFPAERLNTAHFYVRVDKNETFNQVLSDVSDRLAQEAPLVRVINSPPGKLRPQEYLTKKVRTVPTTAYDSKATRSPIEKLVASLSDYRNDEVNTRGVGSRRIATQVVGHTATDDSAWEEFEQSNLVAARWVFVREVKRRYAKALQVASTADGKFDARIGLGSPAFEHIATTAHNVVAAYLDNVTLAQNRVDPYTVGPILARKDDLELFHNALHDGYDGLNALEREFARALDATGLDWCRNPSQTGYGIPLITLGATTTFYPDFLIWRGDQVIAVDTKGEHLLVDAAGRKLLAIRPAVGVSTRLIIRFVSRGHLNDKIEQEDKEGATIFSRREEDGKIRTTHADSVADALTALLA